MKITAIFLIITLSVFIFANDFMQPTQTAIDDQNQITRSGTRSGHREQDSAPEYSFILNGNSDPTTFLANSYYDYMPFSLNGHNVRIQPEFSMPNGYTAGGIYITSCASDHYTGDPFAVWHAVTEPDGSYDSHMSYNTFHATGGGWRIPFIVIDNPEMSLPYTGHDDDVFIWPQVWVGQSPLADHRRIHAYGNNSANSEGGPNSLYLYADFTDTDLLASSDLDWTVQSFPYFDELTYNNLALIRKDMIVSEVDGKVVFFGNVADSLFALFSNDYGETFTKYTQQLKQPMDNSTNINTGEPVWENDDGSPAEMFIIPSYDLSHYNGVFTDDYTKIKWMSGVNYNSQENIDEDIYMAAYIYPKIFTFNTDSGEFSFYDLDVQDTDPGDDHLAVAFDLNDDGEVDEYDVDGWPIIVMSCPSWFFNSDGGWQDSYFHESNCKMTSNENF
jgi:hypothetical protein